MVVIHQKFPCQKQFGLHNLELLLEFSLLIFHKVILNILHQITWLCATTVQLLRYHNLSLKPAQFKTHTHTIECDTLLCHIISLQYVRNQ